MSECYISEADNKRNYSKSQFNEVKKILKDFGIIVTAAPKEVKTYFELHQWKKSLIKNQ